MKQCTRLVVIAVGIATLVGVFEGQVFAQSKTNRPEEGKRVKTYDFSGDDIDGDLVKPDGEFLDTRKFATHTSLIAIRKDFIREIIKSADDL